MFGESERTKAARDKIGMGSKSGTSWGTNLKPSTARPLIAFSLIGYPAGCILTLVAGTKFVAAAGLLLVAAAFVAAVPVFASRMQKIVGEEKVPLDEYELMLRQRTLSTAYYLLAGLILLALIYGGLATDHDWWLPTVDTHWNALFAGAVMYAVLIPTAVLAFRSKDPVDDDL